MSPGAPLPSASPIRIAFLFVSHSIAASACGVLASVVYPSKAVVVCDPCVGRMRLSPPCALLRSEPRAVFECPSHKRSRGSTGVQVGGSFTDLPHAPSDLSCAGGLICTGLCAGRTGEEGGVCRCLAGQVSHVFHGRQLAGRSTEPFRAQLAPPTGSFMGSSFHAALTMGGV